MKIAFCTPFKPIDHPTLSGDVTIARDLYATLQALGHEVIALDHYPAKQIHKHPLRWLEAAKARKAMIEQANDADCWFTYGSYYKVPDIFGPLAAEQLDIPYFIFQASYAVNRSKKLGTLGGYRLNKRAMLAADHIFCNRINDLRGCAKLLPEDRYSHVKPGLPDAMFLRDESARIRHREAWKVGDTPVIITTAMMRHGVKTEGLKWVIRSCAELLAQGQDLQLIVAGDGPRRLEIEELAIAKLGEKVRFLGMVDRAELDGVFSAGELFAFPGLEESVGMVYLEAQQCGLPCVATDDEGAPHVISHEESGLITSVNEDEFTKGISKLLGNTDMRTRMGQAAIKYVAANHMGIDNYRTMTETMERITLQRKEI